jgi:hypothetical protein
MSEYDDATIEAAGKLVVRAVRLRRQIGAMATWCEADEIGRYSLDLLVQNLSAISVNNGDNDIPIAKLLR